MDVSTLNQLAHSSSCGLGVSERKSREHEREGDGFKKIDSDRF